jgi:type III pantothenate kinase
MMYPADGDWRLYADAGNTALKWAVRCGDCWAAQGRVENDALECAPREIAAALTLIGLEPEECAGVALVSSRPALTDAAEAVLSATTGLPVRLLGREMRAEIEVAYADPAQIGQDRLAAAEGALAIVGAPAIVLALGTCVTAQAIDASGVLQGGVIAAGIEAQAEGIATAVPHLCEPLAEALRVLRSGDTLPPIGRTSAQNLALGLALSLRGTVDALIAAMRREVGGAPVVATGRRQ